MTNKILITGCAGFIGSNLVDDLLLSGDEVIGIDNFDNYYSIELKRENLRNALMYPNFKFYEADITDENSFNQILSDNNHIDTLIHLAALPGVQPSFDRPEDYFRINVDGTRNVFQSAIKYGIKHFIHASSSSVYGELQNEKALEDITPLNPISPYAESKFQAENAIREIFEKHPNISINIFRFFTVYGSRQRPDMAFSKFRRVLTKGEPIELYGENVSRDFTPVTRIVRGIKAGIDYHNGLEVFNLGSGEKVLVKNMIQQIAHEIGVEPDIIVVKRQKGDPSYTLADISKAKRLLGY